LWLLVGVQAVELLTGLVAVAVQVVIVLAQAIP
jgi:hypothetical protein